MPDIEFTYEAPPPNVMEFSPPLKSGNGFLEGLALREPKSREVWAAEIHLKDRNNNRGPRLYQRALLARVSGVPEDVISDLPMSIFVKASAYLQAFVEADLDDVNEEAPDGTFATTMTIRLAEPIKAGELQHTAIRLTEPTLGHMATADSALKDMSPQRMRQFQQNLVQLCSDAPALLVDVLPISVLNRAATFLLGFSQRDRTPST